MTTSTYLTVAETTSPDQSGSPKSRSFKRIGAAGLAFGLVLGAGVAVGTHVAAQTEQSDTMTPPSLIVAMKGQRAFDSRTDLQGRDPGAEKFRNQEGPARSFDVPVGEFIPPEAVGVVYSVTVTATEGSGYVSVDTYVPSPDEAGSEISTAAWTEPGQRVVNSGIVKTFETNTRGVPLIRVSIGGAPDAAAHVIIDITGYLIPAG